MLQEYPSWPVVVFDITDHVIFWKTLSSSGCSGCLAVDLLPVPNKRAHVSNQPSSIDTH